MKKCSKCQTYKYEEAFYNNKAKADGLENYCKPCKKAAVAAYQKTDKGKTCAARAQRKFIDTPHGRAKKQEWERNWKKTDKGRAYDTAKSLRRYYSDPEHHKLKVTARRHGCPVGILKQILERDKVCQLCGSDKDLQFDHVYPQSKGGVGSLENLQILCDKCNNFKSNHFFLPTGGMMLTGKQVYK